MIKIKIFKTIEELVIKKGSGGFAENFTNCFFNHSSIPLSVWTYHTRLPAEFFNDIILGIIYVNFRN